MRRQAYLRDHGEGWDWLPTRVMRGEDNEKARENSPHAVFGEMLRVATMIIGVAFAVAFAFNAIHLG